MTARKHFDRLKVLGALPQEGRVEWLAGAESSIHFLRTDAAAEFVVLYTSMPCAWIVSAVVSQSNFVGIDTTSLSNADFGLDNTWAIQRISGGSDGHRIELEPPFSSGSGVLAGGELPVVRRTFYGMDRREPIEVNQKLVHALNIFWVETRSVYCRLDRNGDLEDVISVLFEPGSTAYGDFDMVAIRASDLAEYLAVSGSVLFRRFDFTRVDHSSFGGWAETERSEKRAPDLVYSFGVGGGNGSYANGYQIVHPAVTVEELTRAWQAEDTARRADKEYETFIAQDWKNNCIVEVSCSPDTTANYFTESDKPFELSPAFFRAEVLTKYKGDPQKYRLEERSISCRNAWSLKTYDINDEGQVHTYLCYLADLPISEQRYWRSFNERPKGPISKRAFETDFEGTWTTQYDPLNELKEKVATLNGSAPLWWAVRSDEVVQTVRYPATASEREWADEILALEQMVVEGFVETKLRMIVQAQGGQKPEHSGSLNALHAALAACGLRNEEAMATVAPLKELRHLRSKVRGHSTSEKAELSAQALSKFQTYRAHFTELADRCNSAIDRIIAALPSGS